VAEKGNKIGEINVGHLSKMDPEEMGKVLVTKEVVTKQMEIREDSKKTEPKKKLRKTPPPPQPIP